MPKPAPVLRKIRPPVALSGIIKNQYGEFIAYISINKNSPIGVRKGDVVETFKVADIMQRTVILRWNDEIIKLELKKSAILK